MKYVSDVITEEEFMDWKPGQRVFITAATGTGKSYFILYKLLLERAMKKEEKILYLVNRKILENQLKKYIDDNISNDIYIKYRNPINKKSHICVMTYQSIEEKIQKDLRGLKEFMDKFDIAVYDECHYFYMDSNFNTYTELSYDCLRRSFGKKIQVFMSATMERVRAYFDEYNGRYFLDELNPLRVETTGYGSIMPVFPMDKGIKNGLEDRSFPVDQDYSYVNIKVFEKYEELIEIIKNNVSEKWLVFIDSIEKGKELQEQLLKEIQEDDEQEHIEKDDIVLVDAEFKKNEDSNLTVEEIVQYERFIKKRILIATSVMDNGVTIFDDELRNIVILYDTKEEFIQMLGRKRNDGGKIDLYICKRNSNYFRLRLLGMERKLKFFHDYGKNIEDMYKRKIYNPNCSYNCRLDCKNVYINCLNRCPNAMKCYNACWVLCQSSCRSVCQYDCRKDCKSVFDVTPYFDMYGNNYVNNYGYIYQSYINQMLYLQQGALKYIVDNNFNSHILFTLNGFIAINFFSIKRIQDLYGFYSDMKEKMEEDKYAFVREQMSWLGIEECRIDEYIVDIEKNLDEKYIDILKDNIEEVLEKALDEEENKELRRKISDAMVYFISKEDENAAKEYKRNTRPISERKFNKCMQVAGLPYIMEKPKGKIYKIIKQEERSE